MKRNLGDKSRIAHILEAIEKIEVIMTDVSYDDFCSNFEKKLAIERLLEIIGEAVNHISEELLYGRETSAPWKQIVATRNMISHEYFRIDESIIYQIVTKEIVPLKKDILVIKSNLE